MRTYTDYDPSLNVAVQVPETELSHVAFCDLARAAWATTRRALGLPAVDAVFAWTNDGQANRVGDTVLRDRVCHRLSDQVHTLIRPSDVPGDIIAGFAQMLSARRPVPAVFGRLVLPQNIYWAAVLTAPSDDFALRVLHNWMYGDPGAVGVWTTRLDVLYAPAETSERALTLVSPACPKCGAACYWEEPTYARQTPQALLAVACGSCSWKGVSPVVA